MIRAITLFLISMLLIETSSAAQDASCGKLGAFFPEKLKKKNSRMVIIDLTGKDYEKNVLRYLQATQGKPPDFKLYPNHKAYFAYIKAYQFCDSMGCTPAPLSRIAFTINDCIVYRIDGPQLKLRDIVLGTWSLQN